MRQTTIAAYLVLLFTLVGCTGIAEESTTSSQPFPATSIASSPTTSTPHAATTSTPPSPTTDDTRLCTDIGCDSVLTIELEDVDITPRAAYGIEICVDGACLAETIVIDDPHPGSNEITRGESISPRVVVWAEDDYIDYYLPGEDYGPSASVTFTITDSGGKVLVQTGEPTDVPLQQSQPNGPGCPPVCYHGRVSI